MRANTIYQEFVDRFPEMKDEIQEYYESFVNGDESYGYIWERAIIYPVNHLFVTEERLKENEDLLRRIFQFFEEMTYSEDVEVINILIDYTFYPLTSDSCRFKRLIKFIGKRSMILYRIMLQSYGPVEEFDEIGPAYLKHYYAKGEQSWENCYLDFIDKWVRKSEEEKSKDKEEKLD